jgi:hypothetical protein
VPLGGEAGPTPHGAMSGRGVEYIQKFRKVNDLFSDLFSASRLLTMGASPQTRVIVDLGSDRDNGQANRYLVSHIVHFASRAFPWTRCSAFTTRCAGAANSSFVHRNATTRVYKQICDRRETSCDMNDLR